MHMAIRQLTHIFVYYQFLQFLGETLVPLSFLHEQLIPPCSVTRPIIYLKTTSDMN